MNASSDTLDNKPDASGGGADDLLSQMAGEEINRLLAGAELDEPAEPSAARPLSHEAAPPALDAAADNPPVPSDTLSKELDQVFTRQTAAATQPSSAVADSERISQSGPDASRTDSLPADSVAELLGSLNAGEAPAAETSAATTGNAAAEPAPAATAEVEPIAIRTVMAATESRWSRLAEWITLPLDPFPDDVRDIVGKVAIVTAINAVAIWLYVVIFR